MKRVEIKGTAIPGVLIRIHDGVRYGEIEEALWASDAFQRLGPVGVTLEVNSASLTPEELKRVVALIQEKGGVILRVKGAELPPHSIPSSAPPLVFRRNLRGGQRVEHLGDIIIAGDVNPDAYVIAGGNIVVFGRAQGILVAGKRGDPKAIVVAWQLTPQRIEIAGVSATVSPERRRATKLRGPQRAFLENGRIVIETL